MRLRKIMGGGAITNYTVTFNITPSDATVNYSIDSQTYNQTTTGTGTVSNVPHGSTIYYKISKGGYETITKSQVVNSDVTVTETMNPTYYILVDNSSNYDTFIIKYLNGDRNLTEKINIPSKSMNYKVDGLMYGFTIWDNDEGMATSVDKIDASNLNTSGMTNVSFFTAGGSTCDNLKIINVSNWDVSNVTDMNSCFDACSQVTNIIGISDWDVSNVIDMRGMFSDCSKLTSLDLSKWNVSNVTNIELMFRYCQSLKTLNLSNFDISKITSISETFQCNNLEFLDISTWGEPVNLTGSMSAYMAFNVPSNIHIKCKQAFKNWCLSQDYEHLEWRFIGGDINSINWEIVD